MGKNLDFKVAIHGTGPSGGADKVTVEIADFQYQAAKHLLNRKFGVKMTLQPPSQILRIFLYPKEVGGCTFSASREGFLKLTSSKAEFNRWGNVFKGVKMMDAKWSLVDQRGINIEVDLTLAKPVTARSKTPKTPTLYDKKKERIKQAKVLSFEAIAGLFNNTRSPVSSSLGNELSQAVALSEIDRLQPERHKFLMQEILRVGRELLKNDSDLLYRCLLTYNIAPTKGSNEWRDVCQVMKAYASRKYPPKDKERDFGFLLGLATYLKHFNDANVDMPGHPSIDEYVRKFKHPVFRPTNDGAFLLSPIAKFEAWKNKARARYQQNYILPGQYGIPNQLKSKFDDLIIEIRSYGRASDGAIPELVMKSIEGQLDTMMKNLHETFFSNT